MDEGKPKPSSYDLTMMRPTERMEVKYGKQNTDSIRKIITSIG